VQLLEEWQREAARARDRATDMHALSSKTLAEVCNRLWRLKVHMVDPATGQPREPMRHEYRQVESAMRALDEAGVEILGHDGEVLPKGGEVALVVVGWQQMPGLTRVQVIETLKPSVYHNGRLVQAGDVIVGTPEQQAS